MNFHPSLLRLAFRQFWFLFGGIWLLVGSIFAVVGGGMLWNEWRFRTQGADAEATVVEKYTRRGGKGSTKYYIAYEFTTPDGYNISDSDQVDRSTWDGVEQGSKIRVRYLPATPEKSDIPDSSDIWLPTIFGGIGVVFGGIGAVLFFKGLNRARTISRLIRDGIPTEGTVVAVQESNITINRVRQWEVRYSYHDHIGQVHEASSEYMPPREAQKWKEGDKGAVRYDQNRPEVSCWLGREEM